MTRDNKEHDELDTDGALAARAVDEYTPDFDKICRNSYYKQALRTADAWRSNNGTFSRAEFERWQEKFRLYRYRLQHYGYSYINQTGSLNYGPYEKELRRTGFSKSAYIRYKEKMHRQECTSNSLHQHTNNGIGDAGRTLAEAGTDNHRLHQDALSDIR